MSNSACCNDFWCQLEKLLGFRAFLESPTSPQVGESDLEEVQTGAPLIGYKIHNQGYNSTFCGPYHPWDWFFLAWSLVTLPTFWSLVTLRYIFTYTFTIQINHSCRQIYHSHGMVVGGPETTPGRAVPGPTHSDPAGDLASGRRGEGAPGGCRTGGA